MKVRFSFMSILVSYDCRIKLPQTWWLKKAEMYSLKVIEARFQNQWGKIDVLTGLYCCQRRQRMTCSLPLPSSGGHWHFLTCDHVTLISTSIITLLTPLLCVCQIFLYASFIRTLAMALRAHVDDPGWSHLKILNLITPAKSIFPNEVTFTSFMG